MIKWHEGLSLGVKSIDDDHKQLLNIINRLSDAIRDGNAQEIIDKTFQDLEKYVIEHFHREELLLAKCNCLHIKEHIAQHREFAKKVPELKAKLANAKNSAMAQEVSYFLTDWLFNHIIEEDIPTIGLFEKCGLTEQKKNKKKNFISQITKKTIENFSFTKRIFLSAIIPLLGMLLFGTIILFNNLTTYINMKKTSSITKIVSNVDRVVHDMQIERGLSSGDITCIDGKFKDSLKEQRHTLDISAKKFLEEVNLASIKRIDVIQPYIKTFQMDHSSLKELRDKIDAKTITQAEAIKSYTKIIKNILNITPKIAFLNYDREISSNITTLSSLQHLKESLGKQRAYATMLIENKDGLLEEFIDFATLEGTQEAFFETFKQSASKSQKNAYNSIMISDIAKKVDEYKESIYLRKFDSLNSQVWFDSMTDLIDEIKIFEDSLLFKIDSLVDASIDDSVIHLLLWLSFATTILIVTLSMLYTFRTSTKYQIHQLTDAMKDLAKGGRSLRLSPININRDELAFMYDAYETTRQKLLKGDIYTQLYLSKKELEIQTHQKQNVELQEMAYIDPLTGAINRRKFDELSQEELERSNRYKSELSFLMLDIDHFKNINDTYGHDAGDEVLKHFSAICLKMARSLDIVARVGGEEFVVMLRETDSKGAFIFAERFRQEIFDSELNIDGNIIKYSVSIGISSRKEDDKDVRSILQRADKALYEAKNAGRNRSVVYSNAAKN
ncbi:MAG: bacteriohemerythrin [Sulfurimonas sp.]|uniref:bacteriohemerythrin n=1 Tax=Sulfurimonas sp. TaxID=2022749 RepID=UPI0025FD919D|nr:bacteriohemerythrin [Sulfurimonas sp.]MCK9491161.1 bacteriohemerythrin [Sulfurimonas sp.]